MSRRGSNIFKRKDGRWEGRYKSGIKENGWAKYSSVYAPSYAECAEKLKAVKMWEPSVKRSPTVRELFDMWLCNRKNSIKQSTYSSYSALYENYIHKEIGGCKADDVTSEIITQLEDDLISSGGRNGKGLSPVTVQAALVMLKSVFRYGLAEYGIGDPFRSVFMPKAEPKEIQVFSDIEIGKLKVAAGSHDVCAVGVLLTLYTGLRIGEICALTWNDIDLEHNIIKVSKTLCRIKNPTGESPKTVIVITSPKSKKSIREIPLPPAMIPVLSRMKRSCSDNDYFLTGTDKYTEPRSYAEKYKRHLERLEVPYKNYHVLRHTFATACIRQGIDVKTVSELLGHSSVKITLEKYVHSDMALKRRQLEKLYSDL